MKRFALHTAVLLALCAVVTAQEPPVVFPEAPSRIDSYMETGMEVQGVRAPYYDEEGNLRAQLYGGYAKVLEGGAADVKNLRIDVYKDGEVDMTIFAPQCFTQVAEIEGLPGKKVLSIHSEGDVLIDMDQMTIYGRGFRYTSEGNRFEILNDSKVLVRESIRAAEGVEL